MGLIMLIFLILLPVQCNARVGPYNYVEHGFATKEEKALYIGDHRQAIPSNQNAGDGNTGILASKNIGLSLSLLAKGSPIPPSGPSPGHN